MDDEGKTGDFKYEEKITKDFVCINEYYHTYISVSDMLCYELRTHEKGKYSWRFYICGGKFFISKNFDTEKEALAWFEETFKDKKE